MKDINFADYIQENHLISLRDASKKEVIEKLVQFGAGVKGIEQDKIWQVVWAREEQLSTAIGHGVALPHGRINDFGDLLIVVGVCENEIPDYVGPDGFPVRVVFLVVSDTDDRERYLGILKSLSRHLLKQPEMVSGIFDKCRESADFIAALRQQL